MIREVSFFTGKGGLLKIGGSNTFLRSKGGSKDFFTLKKGDHLHFLKETKYFVKYFRFHRKGFSDATWGRKFQWDILSQCKSVQLLSRFDVDFS